MIDYDPNDTRTHAEYINTPKGDAGDIFTCWPIVEIKSGKLPVFECRDCGQACMQLLATLADGNELVRCPACKEIRQYHYTPQEQWL
jgi:phage FluMu protein Com